MNSKSEFNRSKLPRIVVEHDVDDEDATFEETSKSAKNKENVRLHQVDTLFWGQDVSNVWPGGIPLHLEEGEDRVVMLGEQSPLKLDLIN